ncbi:MAG TPA: MFS transporter [Candidatus Dormibacteraeota bacterium]|nr:MFS transporter [Candidatus Dormibacteraeota bacterium]
MNEQEASLRENLRALPRGAWVLFFGTFLNKFGTFVLPFLAIYMTGLGFTAAQSGLAIAAYGIGTLCACLLGGHLADRLGRRKTIVLSMFSVGLAMLCLSQARSLAMIVLFSCLAGLTGELYRPASSALLADLVPAGQRVTAYAAYRMAFNAGWAFGPATAGLLAKKSFLWLFVGDAATSLLYGIVAWVALPAGLRGIRTSNTLLETFRVLRTDKRFLQVVCAALAIGLVFVQAFSTMSLEITHNGFSPATYGLVISLNGVLVVLCELPLTTITKRFPARRVIACGFFLIGIGFASNLLTRTLPLLFLTTALFTFGEMISMPVCGAYVADLAPVQQRGLYMGTYGMVWALAFVCGPSLGLILFSFNHLLLWASCGIMGLVSALIIVAEPRQHEIPGTAKPLASV